MRPAAIHIAAHRYMLEFGKEQRSSLGGVGLITLLLPSLSHLSLPLCLSPLCVRAAWCSRCVSGGVLPLVYPLDLILTVVGGT